MVDIVINGMTENIADQVKQKFEGAIITEYDDDHIYTDTLYVAFIKTKFEMVPYKIGIICKMLTKDDFLYISIE
jgi:hypothetical protein